MKDLNDCKTIDMFEGAVVVERRTYANDLYDFHDKFGLGYSGPPRMLEPEELGFRIRFLQEELAEVKEALLEEDLAQVGGELCDLVWIALGLAHRMGLDFDAHWAEIRRANMSKERASAENPGKRGSSIDIVKPVGWKRPDHDDVLLATIAAASN